MAYIQEVNGRFKATIRVSGKRTAKTFATHREAEAWAVAYARPNNPDKDTAYLSVADAMEQYLQKAVPAMKSKLQTTQIINQLLRDCSWLALPYGHLTADIIRQWRNARLRIVSPSSVSRHMDVIKSACAWAETELDASTQLETIKRVKIDKPKQQEKNHRPTKETLERVMWAADQAEVKWLRPVIEFALETAMRRSEITKLQWKHVYISKGRLTVVDPKNGRDRTIALSPKAVELLTAQVGQRYTKENSLRTNGTSVWGISSNQLTKAWQRCKKRADVDMRFHDLRHEAASRFFEMGMSPIEVATMTGHRTMSQVMRYSHADLNQIAAKWGQ